MINQRIQELEKANEEKTNSMGLLENENAMLTLEMNELRLINPLSLYSDIN